MNLQIRRVLSHIAGAIGAAIVQAIVVGKRHPLRLVALCHVKVHADRHTVARSRTGNSRPEHLFTLNPRSKE
ncbi:MAG: hypothetical protein ACRD19_00770 [Terriglobia bacterium]